MPTDLVTISKELIAIVPLSLFGLWRWSMWLSRKIISQFYKPLKTIWPPTQPKPRISVVVPVYNEDPKIFALAMKSWINNGVDEIIAVIDHTNTNHIVNFERIYSKLKHVKCKAIVTKKPGKRPALADGIEVANGEIIALVDSDTIWSANVANKMLPYFLQPRVGGVSAQQRVYKPKTIAQILFDIVLWTRYNEELPFLLGSGEVINTLSGRTAFYRRTALLHKKHDNIHNLTHEHYYKSRCISGDDKRLTHLIMEQGWYTSYAQDALVYTPGMNDMKTFLKQRLRWTRNSWRADTRAFKRKWILKHPTLAFYNMDRFLQPVFMLIGPIIFVFAIIQQAWLVVLGLIIWWALSRFIRLFGYFKENPKKLVYLPIYIIFSYYNALIKIYAWATILEQGWITRWDKKRLAKKKRKTAIIGVTTTAAVCLIMSFIVAKLHIDLKQLSAAITQSNEVYQLLPELKNNQVAMTSPPIAATATPNTELAVYTVVGGDNPTIISRKINVPVDEILKTNRLSKNTILSIGDPIYYVPR